MYLRRRETFVLLILDLGLFTANRDKTYFYKSLQMQMLQFQVVKNFFGNKKSFHLNTMHILSREDNAISF